MTIKKFLVLHLVLTAVVCIAAFFPVQNLYGTEYLWLAYLAIGITSTSSLLAFMLVVKSLEKSFRNFLNFVLGAMMSKMLVGIIVIVSLGLSLAREKLMFFTVLFMIGYLVFTTLEVTSLMIKNREVTRNKDDQEKISDNQHKNS